MSSKWVARGATVLALVVASVATPAALAGYGNVAPSKPAAATRVAPSCGYSVSQVFAPFGDAAWYFLAPGGDAESARWTLAGGATVLPGVGVLGFGSHVYALRSGASVTSPAFCLGFDSPTMRFSYRDPGVSGATLSVEAIWANQSGSPVTVTIARIRSGAPGLHLADPSFLLANLDALVGSTGTTTMQLRFAASGGSWQVDDVYVDPYKRI
ncbi:MAG: hypothetical protein U0R50_07975 [Gaiellales bacterium]